MEFIIELPEGYKQVQYIETTGSQFIDTGILPNTSTRWELDIQYTEKSTNQYCYNGLYNNSNCRFDIAYVKNGNFRLNIGSQSTFEPRKGDSSRHLFALDIPRKRVEIDEDIYECSFNFTNATKGGIRIGNRYDESISYPCSEKIYVSKIYSNDIFEQYLIPCYRVSDHVVGMYDLIGKNFYENSGTGAFIEGPEILNGGNNNFSNNYTKVQYIEGTGTQYIDTLYRLNSNSNVSIEYKLTELDTITRGRGIFGCYEGPKSRYEIFARKDGYVEPGFYDVYDSKTLQLDLDRHTIVIQNGEACLDNNRSVSLGKGTFEQKNTAYLFHFNSEITDYLPMKGRIYSAKIWDGEKIVRDLVPCYRNHDNTAGMYDMVEDIFYTNSGTGTFLYGPEV